MTHKAYHLELDPEHMEGNNGLGRYVFLPGSPKRAARMSEYFTDATVCKTSRQLDSYYGRLVRGDLSVDVAVVPTGMGTPSVDIVLWELMQIGARRFIRTGTTGTLQPHVKGGDVVIATAAVRDTGCPEAYAPTEYPAAGDPVMVEMFSHAALRLGQGDRVHAGLVHTKDSFFGREYGQGPYKERNREYMQHLVRSNVLVTEMEAGQLYVMGSVFGGAPSTITASRTAEVPIRCGALLAVIGDLDGFFGPEIAHETEGRMLELAMEGVLDLAALELG